MRAFIVLFLAALCLLWPGTARAADILVFVSDSNGASAELTLVSGKYSYELKAAEGHILTVSVSGPVDHWFSINNGKLYQGQATGQMLVREGGVVRICQVTPDGDSFNYELRLLIKTNAEPEKPGLGEPETPPPPAEPEQPPVDPEPPSANPEQPTPATPQTPAEAAPAGELTAAELSPSPADQGGAGGSIRLTLRIGSREMTVNGQAMLMDVSPFLQAAGGSGHTMVPIRFIAEGLGAAVTWDGAAKQAHIRHEGQELILTIGQPVNDSGIAALLRDSRTFVPLRYVMESLGAQVLWSSDQSITIISGQTANSPPA